MERPHIYKHRSAGWLLVMPGHDPVEVGSFAGAVELLRQLDDRPAPPAPAPVVVELPALPRRRRWSRAA